MEAYVTGCRTTDTARMSGVTNGVAANSIDNWSKRMEKTPPAKTKKGYRRYMYKKPRKTTDDGVLSRATNKPRKAADNAFLSLAATDVPNVYEGIILQCDYRAMAL